MTGGWAAVGAAGAGWGEAAAVDGWRREGTENEQQMTIIENDYMQTVTAMKMGKQS